MNEGKASWADWLDWRYLYVVQANRNNGLEKLSTSRLTDWICLLFRRNEITRAEITFGAERCGHSAMITTRELHSIKAHSCGALLFGFLPCLASVAIVAERQQSGGRSSVPINKMCSIGSAFDARCESIAIELFRQSWPVPPSLLHRPSR